MPHLLVLYHSAFGHIEAMAAAAVEGVREAGAQATLKRVPNLIHEGAADEPDVSASDTPIASVRELADYDGLIIGTPTHFGSMSAPMKHFIDRCAGLWSRDLLVGKIGGAFTSSGSQHGGQESTLRSVHTSLMHLGILVAGLPYSFEGQLRMDEITGGTPYGASTVTDGDGSRLPSDNDLAGARFQGRHIAELAIHLTRGRQRPVREAV